MNGKECFDIAVIGAGIAGASVAYRLAGERRVVVLEREEQPGYHATGRSAAMFMEYYGTPQIRALTRASRAFYTRPPQGFTEHPLLRRRGCLYVAAQGQEALLRQIFDQNYARAGNVRMLDSDETLRIVPALRADIVSGAIYEEDVADVDVHGLHHGYLNGFRKRGGQLRCDAEVVAVRREAPVWVLTLADGSDIRARQIVNAAGAWADRLAELCEVPAVGLQPHRRTAFTFDGPADLDFDSWPIVVGLDERFYFKPEAGQLLGSPANADPMPPHDVMAEEVDVATGMYYIEEVAALGIRRPSHSWAGLRSFVADGDLVVGWDNHREDFFWLAAQGGYGIQSAAGVAELAEALLLGKPLPGTLAAEGVEPSCLSPARLR